MVALIAIPAITLSLLQASITAPTDAFRGCLRTASEKAKSENVGGDKIADYLRTTCTVQMGTLKDALVAFRIKNGMGKKAAAEDASMTVDDYVSTPVDHYQYMLQQGAKNAAPAAAAAANQQPPKP